MFADVGSLPSEDPFGSCCAYATHIGVNPNSFPTSHTPDVPGFGCVEEFCRQLDSNSRLKAPQLPQKGFVLSVSQVNSLHVLRKL